MRKVLSFVVALALVSSLAVPVFADTPHFIASIPYSYKAEKSTLLYSKVLFSVTIKQGDKSMLTISHKRYKIVANHYLYNL